MNFTIKGESLTDMARSLWEEPNHTKAIKLLIDSLDGLTEVQALDVCIGRMKFTGENSNIELVDDDLTKGTHNLIELIKDQDNEIKELSEVNVGLSQLANNDIAFFKVGNDYVEIPYRYRYLGSKRFQNSLSNDFYDAKFKTKNVKRLDAIEREDKFNKGMALLQPTIAAVRLPPPPTLTELPLPLPAKPKPIAHNEITHNVGWLAPFGKFYECKATEHAELAEELCNIYGYKIEDVFSVKQPEQTLERMNWYKLYHNTYQLNAFDNKFEIKRTKMQEKMIDEWCLKNNIKIDWYY